MKILAIEEHEALFRTTEGDSFHPIKDISEDDVLAIVKLILDGSDLEMDDEPSNDEGRNPAELVIYRELKKQFSSLISKRDEKLQAINDQFRDAEAFYKDERLKNELFENAGDGSQL